MGYEEYSQYDNEKISSNINTIECETQQQDDVSQVINNVSAVLNRIHGKNGETYHVPIIAAHLSSLEAFIQRLLYTDELPYKVYGAAGKVRVHARKMAYDIKMLPAYARIHSPSLSYSPDLEFFFDEYRKHEISQCAHIDWGVGDDESMLRDIVARSVDPKYADMANDFVLAVRNSAKEKRLKSRISDWLSGCLRNRQKLKNFMIELFEENSRIMAVNVVLLYKKSACDNRKDAIARRDALQARHEREYRAYLDGTEAAEVPEQWVSLQELKSDLKRLFNNKRHKTLLFDKKKFIDYYGRIEYAQGAGYHVHLCFFYKGAEAHQDIWYSHEIGKYWEKITDGRGYYFSCNAKAAQGGYKNVGIGIVEHDNTEKLQHLWRAVSYFVKAAQIVRVKHTEKAQMVLRGKRRKRQGEKLGRPRREGFCGPEYRSLLEKIFT